MSESSEEEENRKLFNFNGYDVGRYNSNREQQLNAANTYGVNTSDGIDNTSRQVSLDYGNSGADNTDWKMQYNKLLGIMSNKSNGKATGADYGNLAVKAIAGAGSLWMQKKLYDQSREAFKFNKRATMANWGVQAGNHNRKIEGNYRSRAILGGEGYSGLSVAEGLEKYGVDPNALGKR